MGCESAALQNWHLALGQYRVSDGFVVKNTEELTKYWLVLDLEETILCWVETGVA